MWPKITVTLLFFRILATNKPYLMNKLLLFLLVLFSFTATAQVDKAKIKAQAEEAAQALLKGDYDVLKTYTYPKVAEEYGSIDRMMTMAKSGRDDLEAMGIALDSIVVGEPTDPVTAGNQLHCLIPQATVIRKPDGKVTTESYLLGVSLDQGNHWYFISMPNLTAEAIKQLLSYYNPELVIPEKKPSVFKPN
jgi:hypothetical protein